MDTLIGPGEGIGGFNQFELHKATSRFLKNNLVVNPGAIPRTVPRGTVKPLEPNTYQLGGS